MRVLQTRYSTGVFSMATLQTKLPQMQGAVGQGSTVCVQIICLLLLAALAAGSQAA